MFLPRSPEPLPAADPRCLQRRLQLLADGVCRRILDPDYPEVDVWIEAGRVLDFAEQHFPDCGELFAMVYEARFRRLFAQFRGAPAGT